jgi:hypothetical protein
MPTPISEVVRTIVSLRQLQLQEAAQQLARHQGEVSAQSSFSSMLPGLDDPNALLPHLSQFAQTTGLPEDVLQTIVQHTPASSSTTKSRAVQTGAAELGGGADQTSALVDLTGLTPGVYATDQLRRQLSQGASEYYGSLRPAERDAFHAGVLQNIATGQDVGTAATSTAVADFMNRASPEVKDQIIKIGKGLAPSASEDAQLQLGFANYRNNMRATEANIANESLRTQAALAEARAKLSGKAFDDANTLLEKRDALLQNMVKTSATLTPAGVQTLSETINAYNEQLRRIAPDIYGPSGTVPLSDFPKNTLPGMTGVGEFLKLQMQAH